MEEIAFQAWVGKWRSSLRLEVTPSTGQEEIAAALAKISREAGEKAFEFTGVDLAQVDALAKQAAKGKGIAGLAQSLKETKPALARQAFAKAGGEEKTLLAEARFLSALFQECGVEARPVAGEAKLGASEADLGEGVFFMANARGWISIKKTSVDAKTKPEEVAAALAGVSDSTQRKAFEFSGVDADAVKALAEAAAKGKRKGFAALAEAVSAVPEAQLEESFRASAEVKRQAKALYLSSILGILGYSLIPSGELLQKAFPNLKIPKPRGRFGKAKK